MKKRKSFWLIHRFAPGESKQLLPSISAIFADSLPQFDFLGRDERLGLWRTIFLAGAGAAAATCFAGHPGTAHLPGQVACRTGDQDDGNGELQIHGILPRSASKTSRRG